MTELETLRKAIDDIDQRLLSLLAQRFEFTERVGLLKAKEQLPAQDVRRESEQFQNLIRLSEQCGLNPDYAVKIFRCLMDLVIVRHEELRVKGR